MAVEPTIFAPRPSPFKPQAITCLRSAQAGIAVNHSFQVMEEVTFPL